MTRPAPRHRGRTRAGKLVLLAAAVFFLFVGAAALAGNVPWIVLWLYLGMSVVAFVAYAADKSAARGGRWRTPESTLYLLGLAGGWPGALLARELLRHKSQKASFRNVFWLTVILNCGAFAWLLSPAGAGTFRLFLGAV